MSAALIECSEDAQYVSASLTSTADRQKTNLAKTALVEVDRYVMPTNSMDILEVPCTGERLATLPACQRFLYVNESVTPFQCAEGWSDWILASAGNVRGWAKAGIPGLKKAFVSEGQCKSMPYSLAPLSCQAS